MARAPKKSAAEAEPTAVDTIERRLWVLENALLRKQRAFIAEDGAPCCGTCYKPLGDVYDSGCGHAYPEGVADCQHRAT